MNKLAIVVIAAGNSVRLGQPKQLVMINNQPLIERIIQLGGKFGNRVYCILGHRAEEIASRLEKESVACLTNRNWQKGMGSSIAYGVSQLGDDMDAVMILLCDQWALTHQDLNLLFQQWQSDPEKIVACAYGDESQTPQVCGVPAIFPRKYFPELVGLKKTGARKLLANYRSEVVAIKIANAGSDLDTPADLRKLRDCHH